MKTGVKSGGKLRQKLSSEKGGKESIFMIIVPYLKRYVYAQTVLRTPAILLTTTKRSSASNRNGHARQSHYIGEKSSVAQTKSERNSKDTRELPREPVISQRG